MRKYLLFCILTLTIVVSYAQQVLIKDSIVGSFDSGKTYTYALQHSYTYDTDCRLIEESTPDSEATFYNYYPDGSLYQITFQIHDLYTNKVSLYSRQTYTYTANKQVATYLYESWYNSQWVPSSLATDTYNDKGQMLESLVQTYQNNGFENLTDTRFIYDANGFLIQTATGTWDNPSHSWIPYSNKIFYLNSQGAADSTVETYLREGIYDKILYLYGASGKSSTVVDYTYTNNALTNIVKTYQGYDSANSVRKDTILHYRTLPAAPDVFTFLNGLFKVSLYNYDGTKKELETHSVSNTNSTGSLLTTYYTYKDCNSALPVTLLYFIGRMQNGSAILQWQTTNEVNISFYTIERSLDGIHFTTSGSIKADAGNSKTGNYTFTDANVNTSSKRTLYYRLAEVNIDGKITYSSVVLLSLTGDNLLLSISPNPVVGEMIVYSPVAIANATICIVNTYGNIVYTSQRNLAAGSRTSIDMSRFARGLYIVTVQSATNRQRYKVAKE